MKGESVQVKRFEATGSDPFGAPIVTEHVDDVDNVLVAPGAVADLFESNRPDGVVVRYTLYFPKTFDASLEGCQVNVRGRWLNVVGDPDHYPADLTPGDWWMVVEVTDTDG